jgi:feruloyl esterase
VATCRFDPASIQCGASRRERCLSPGQVATVERFYAPLRDENGRQRDSGLVPGVRTRPGPPSPLLLPMFAQGAHRDLAWRAEQFHIADDLARVDRAMPELRADDPDLGPFAARGGRLILYHGWLDPSVAASYSVDYYDGVRRELGADRAAQVARLYMVPGMLHCRGGDGVQHLGQAGDSRPIGDARHDLLAALVEWVENGKAPREIIGSRLEAGRIVRQRPLCPYPQRARHLGGDPDVAASFACAAPGEGAP